MKTRIITGACMVAVAIPLLIWSDTPVLSAAIVLLALIGVFEYLRCIGIEKALGFAIPSYLMAAAAPLMARYLNGHWMFFFGVAYVYTFYMLAHAMLTSEKSDFSKVAKAVVGTLYISSGFACLLAARDLEHGLFLLIMIVVTAFGTDIFAYFSGYFFGKHKLITAVSPKKTVEGAIGGTLLAAALFVGCGVLYANLYKVARPHVLSLFVCGALLSVISQLGDLIASYFKRNSGIKDYGKLFPGHGGVLDRFDSVIAIAPIMYILLSDPQIFAIFR